MAHKAPGKAFRQGLSIKALFRMFPDDETAERWFTEVRWSDGVHCPKCDSDNIQERAARKPQPYRCRSCRKDFSVKTDTLMHNSPLGCQTWAIAIYLLTTGLEGRVIHEVAQGPGRDPKDGVAPCHENPGDLRG